MTCAAACFDSVSWTTEKFQPVPLAPLDASCLRTFLLSGAMSARDRKIPRMFLNGDDTIWKTRAIQAHRRLKRLEKEKMEAVRPRAGEESEPSQLEGLVEQVMPANTDGIGKVRAGADSGEAELVRDEVSHHSNLSSDPTLFSDSDASLDIPAVFRREASLSPTPIPQAQVPKRRGQRANIRKGAGGSKGPIPRGQRTKQVGVGRGRAGNPARVGRPSWIPRDNSGAGPSARLQQASVSPLARAGGPRHIGAHKEGRRVGA
ncbi:uncharacterized protein LOC128656776 [Bombina bombina]|uniref:uncharacterized protein LOC128656776 n=1 Tax=Bombina bombina TaxID=8345 RepID=UPI00235AB297|nr:uncharacterized protein LOC128656776 [Bombina bombina]